ncbi:MAG: polyphosphate polymerase domain-containing protein [Bacteroidota bacterium]|nr:polyphosphate polymerase domain-containing protein [Bacteroidota bacterium]
MNNNLRYERKFVVTQQYDKTQIEHVLKFHPAGFYEIFQSRYINNIYLDTPNFLFYHDNNSGKSKRQKARIRWYGDLKGEIQKPILEIKIKYGAVGDKLSFPLKQFTLNQNFSQHDLQKIFRESDLPLDVFEFVTPLSPKLINRYRRKYFQSFDKIFRTTIDDELTYIDFGNNHNTISNKVVNETSFVVELKYAYDKDDKASMISDLFPFRMTKSSKYVNGIDAFNKTLAV